MSPRQVPRTVEPINPPAAPAAPRRFADRDLPEDRRLLVVGPHTVNGASKGEVTTMSLTTSQFDSLVKAGHVVAAPEQDAERPSQAATEEV